MAFSFTSLPKPLPVLSASSAIPAAPKAKAGYIGPQGETGANPLTTTLKPFQGATPTTLSTAQPMTDSGTSTKNGTTTTTVDPYAAWGGQDRYNQLVNDFNTTKNNAYSDVGRNETGAANNYNSSILDYLDQLKSGQTNIDNDSVNNELAKKQGSDSILDMVSHGIRSSAVRLAGGNAASSSAAGQLAEAWAENGRQQESGVDNQYELGKNNVHNEQGQFDSANSTTMRHITESKANVVNDIVNSATQALSDINYRASYANLPDRIDLENEKQRIASEAMGKLQAYDAHLTDGNASVHPMGQDEARGKAFELNQAGKGAPNPFTVNSVLPMSGPTTSSALPLAFYPTKKNNQ